MAQDKIVKLKPTSVRVGIVALAAWLLITAAAKSGLFIDLTEYLDTMLTFAGVAIIFIEVGLGQVLKKRGKGLDMWGMIGLLAGLLMTLSFILQIFGITSTFLDSIQSFIFIGLGIGFFIEAFVR